MESVWKKSTNNREGVKKRANRNWKLQIKTKKTRFCSCIYSNIFHQWSSKNWQNQTKNMMPILLSDWECLQFLTILYAFFRSLHLMCLCVAVILYVFTEQTQIRSHYTARQSNFGWVFIFAVFCVLSTPSTSTGNNECAYAINKTYSNRFVIRVCVKISIERMIENQIDCDAVCLFDVSPKKCCLSFFRFSFGRNPYLI